MEKRKVDEEIILVPYYRNYRTTLPWYQNMEVVNQMDNRDTLYDLSQLKRMYEYLNKNGYLFYIKYKNRLCGDVCLLKNGYLAIVISKPYQNMHIGRRTIQEMIELAKKLGYKEVYAEIYSFNSQSKTMFQSIGFEKVEEEKYRFLIEN